jgi:hypothetical protein
MKEVYVHRLPNDSMADIGKKIDSAAVEAGVILSAKKRKVLITACIRNGECIVKSAAVKAHKELDRVPISVFTDTRALINSKKVEKRFYNIDEVINDCIKKVDDIEKMVGDCSGDDGDCRKLFDSLYDLFYGDKK